MTAVGIALWALAASWLVWLYASRPHLRPYPRYGYLGLAVIGLGEALMFRQIEPVATFFHPHCLDRLHCGRGCSRLLAARGIAAARTRSRVPGRHRDFGPLLACL